MKNVRINIMQHTQFGKRLREVDFICKCSHGDDFFLFTSTNDCMESAQMKMQDSENHGSVYL